MKKKISVLILILMFISAGFSNGSELIIDDSLHNKIAQKYNLEELPNLPEPLQNSTVDNIFTPNEFDAVPDKKYTPNTQTTTAAPQPKPATNVATTKPVAQQTKPVATSLTQSKPVETVKEATQTVVKKVNSSSFTSPLTETNFEAIKLNKGTTFMAVNSKPLSDRLPKGTTITFITTNAETSRYITIPKNTLFIGEVVDSHTPELTGNGGLLVIKVTKFKYNNATYPINAKITLANDKMIFFNNIKGKRKYWHNLVASTSYGKKTYDKMWALTKKYFKPNITLVISPVTFVTGAVVYGANIMVSPVLAVFTKGGSLTIPEHSNFEIKLLEDAIIYK